MSDHEGKLYQPVGKLSTQSREDQKVDLGQIINLKFNLCNTEKHYSWVFWHWA